LIEELVAAAGGGMRVFGLGVHLDGCVSIVVDGFEGGANLVPGQSVFSGVARRHVIVLLAREIFDVKIPDAPPAPKSLDYVAN
jgi:hypothetical protein